MNKLILENFRDFDNKTDFELAPITYAEKTLV